MVGPPAIGAAFDLAVAAGAPEPQFWALAHPLLFLALAWRKLKEVPGLQADSVAPLLDSQAKPKQAVFSRTLGVYVSVGPKAWTLALELVCLFGCSSAAITAAAMELHRKAYSSSAIGLTAIPAGFMQSLCSHSAGRFAGSAKNREVVLLCCPLMLSIMALGIALVGSVHNPLLPIILTLMTCSAAIGAVDPTSMSMMADLAKAASLGYGQAVTASEMAVSLGLTLGPFVAHMMREQNFSSLCFVISLCALLAGVASSCVLRGVPHVEAGEAGNA